jgi:hypothetical protein
MENDTRALVEDRVLDASGLLEKLKKNLIIEHDQDDSLLLGFLMGAVSYAESKQKKPDGTFAREQMPPVTEQAVIMLASSFYESRDGSTAGFFADSTAAGAQSWETIDRLLMLDKDWKF